MSIVKSGANQLKTIEFERDLIREISQEIEWDKLFDLLSREIKKSITINGYVFLAYHELQKSMTIKKVYYDSELQKIEKLLVDNAVVQEQDPVAWKAIENNDVIITDISSSELGDFVKQRLHLMNSRYIAYIPLVKNLVKLGVFCFIRKDMPFQPEELSAIEEKITLFAGQIHNALKYSALKDREAGTNVLSKKTNQILEIAHKLNSLTSLSSIYHLILSELVKIFHFDFGVTYIERDNFLEYVSGFSTEAGQEDFYRLDKWLNETKGYDTNPTHSATAVAFNRNCHFFFNDIPSLMHLPMPEKDREGLSLIKNPKSLLIIPIGNSDSVIGMLHLLSVTRNANLSENDISILKSLCSFISTAINNAKLFTLMEEQKDLLEKQTLELKKTQDEIERIIQISSQINSTLDFESIFKQVADYLKNAYGFEGFSLGLITPDEQHYKVEIWLLPEQMDNIAKGFTSNIFPLDESGGTAAECIRTKKPFFFTDINPAAIQNQANRRMVEFFNIKSILNLPIIINDKSIGIFVLTSHSEFIYLNEKDIDTINRFVIQIAGAIKNSKLYAEIAQKSLELEKANQELESISELTRQVNSTLDFEIISKKVIDYLKISFGFEGYSLGLVTADEKFYKVEILEYPDIISVIDVPLADTLFPLEAGNSRAADCILEKKPFFFTDIDLSQIENEINRNTIKYFQIKSILHLPILVDNKAIGVISLTSHSKPVYLSADDIDVISRFVIQIASSIKNSKLYEEIDKQKAFSNSLLDNSPYGIQVADKTGKIIYVNPACLNISGYTQSQIEGINWTKITDFVDAGLTQDFYNALSGQSIHRENVKFYSLAKNTELLLNITISPILNTRSEIENILIMYHDNTEKAHIEEHVRTLLTELQNKDRIITEDLAMAMRIQQDTLPALSEIKSYQNMALAVKYAPQQIVGGDIYDIYPIKENYYRIFMADATGHGVQAALITMIIKTEYDKIKFFELDCDKILALLNNTFYRKYSQLIVFFSCIIMDIDFTNNVISYCSAGHPAQFLMKPDNDEVISLSAKGRLIGIMPSIDADREEIPFAKGDKLVLFTDGIYEEFNEAGLIFGEERLFELLKMNKNLPVDDLINKIFNVVINFCGKNSLQDDVTIMGIGL